MRESRTYGSVRGAGSNLRPYRDRLARRSKVVRYPRYCGRVRRVASTAVADPQRTISLRADTFSDTIYGKLCQHTIRRSLETQTGPT